MQPASFIEFAHKWSATKRTERAAAQEHFIDLCRLLDEPTPTEADKTGENYAFEKSVTKIGGSAGFADVWRRGHFAWEYKGKHRDLTAAYEQLLRYREGLDNPPLLVVCDLERFEVHTNFTDTAKRVYRFSLADLANASPVRDGSVLAIEVLQALFKAPDRLRPQESREHVTQRAAREFGRIAESLRARGENPTVAARFLVRILFCLFAQDVRLLPRDLFTRLVEGSRGRPTTFSARIRELFRTMANGGDFGVDEIEYFNGGLFTDDEVLPLTTDDLNVLLGACRLDWASVEPSIFGTLFERGFDPDKRAQLGAHYTSREDIQLIVEPVVVAPLRRRWVEVQEQAQSRLDKRNPATGAARARHGRAAHQMLVEFAQELAATRILDPAAGSGNFLYVALRRLLDLEKEAMTFGLVNGLQAWFPYVGPEQLRGIEINLYAHELAQAVVWIGYIQWLRDNGFGQPSPPILKPLVTIQQMDALLAYRDDGEPVEPAWPEAEMIIGNPAFLGGKRLRTELGSQYVEDLFRVYAGRVPREADLVAYWFERSRAMIEAGKAQRAGLLATQSIRRGANRLVLERIKETGDIFYAQADRPWVLDGAAVRVSMVGFDNGTEVNRLLNEAKDDPAELALSQARPVPTIHANLTATLDVTKAFSLIQNHDLCFQGPVKVGRFEVDRALASTLLEAQNLDGRSNSDVVRPWLNGRDITGRPSGRFIIDFGTMPMDEAAMYQAPFEYVRRNILPERAKNRDRQRRENWWRLGRSGSDLKHATDGLKRFICTPRVARHRLFAWVPARTLPDSRLFAFAREDDFFFGVLQSHVHECWALANSSRHGVGNDPTYNNSTCFETFPFPWPIGHEPFDDPKLDAIASAAQNLASKREAWLNPPGVNEAELKSRTLTALYNDRPMWLHLAHQVLDYVVLDAYGWPRELSDGEILERLFALNRERVEGEARAGGQLPLPEPAVVRDESFRRRMSRAANKRPDASAS